MTIDISREVLKWPSRRAVNRGRTVSPFWSMRGGSCVHSNRLTVHGDEGKKNAGLVVTLADKEASGSLMSACAHLLFNPKGDARLRQCVAFWKTVEEAKQQALKPVRVVVCGDFNSYPDSAVSRSWRGAASLRIALEERTAHDDCRSIPSRLRKGGA